MEQVFEMKVKEKTQKLKDSETDVIYRLVFFTFSHRYWNDLIIMEWTLFLFIYLSFLSFLFLFLSFLLMKYSCNAGTNRRSARSRPKNSNWKKNVKPLKMKRPHGKMLPAWRWKRCVGAALKPILESKSHLFRIDNLLFSFVFKVSIRKSCILLKNIFRSRVGFGFYGGGVPITFYDVI